MVPLHDLRWAWEAVVDLAAGCRDPVPASRDRRPALWPRQPVRPCRVSAINLRRAQTQELRARGRLSASVVPRQPADLP